MKKERKLFFHFHCDPGEDSKDGAGAAVAPALISSGSSSRDKSSRARSRRVLALLALSRFGVIAPKDLVTKGRVLDSCSVRALALNETKTDKVFRFPVHFLQHNHPILRITPLVLYSHGDTPHKESRYEYDLSTNPQAG
ncbi:MAG TPA: hypothetical protein VJ579_00950 [Candidatus Paceibacterota bacterium]|nr:hypothetical protein [Candidatus Paceibacterota bacterium]